MGNETRATDWIKYGHFGFSHYRIWGKQTPHGMFQRHEWKHDDGEISMDEWIKSTPGFPTSAKPVSEVVA